MSEDVCEDVQCQKCTNQWTETFTENMFDVNVFLRFMLKIQKSLFYIVILYHIHVPLSFRKINFKGSGWLLLEQKFHISTCKWLFVKHVISTCNPAPIFPFLLTLIAVLYFIVSLASVVWDYSFSTFAKFFEKLKFFASSYTQTRLGIRG